MTRTPVFAFAAAVLLAPPALAQTDKPQKPEEEVKPLTIGDPARPINIEHWIKGDKVTEFKDGKVYVVEFWATWCGPCRLSMPHISELQQKYKDYGVTFIGVSDEPLETVTEFLPKKDKDGKTWNDKTNYTLVTDPDRSVYRDYMNAASQNGIPTAFIIGKDQHVEWIGHPMQMDKPLDEVVKDNWDRQAFKTKWEKEQTAARENAKVQRELRTAMRDKDWDKVLSLLDAQIAADEENFFPKFQKFTVLLQQMDEPEKAYALGEELAKANWDDPMVMNQLAWFVVDTEGIKTRDLDFALRLAKRGVELDENNPAILDTLARVYYEKGDLTEAIKWQKKAVEHAEEGPMAEDIRTTLKKYQDQQAKKKESR